MLSDILVPQKIGNYYLFSKRVLSFDVTPMMVQGLLLDYTGSTIQIKNKITIALKDFSPQSQTNAIKKIASTIGKYDEVVTSLSSSLVVFKEIQLPFLGRDKLEMIVTYEVESLLPFSLDQAVIDFIITAEDLDKKISTVLVAAVRKEDVDNQYALFEKAEVAVSVITIDVFALYTLYFYGMYTGSKVIPAVSMQQTSQSEPIIPSNSHFSTFKKYFSKIKSFLSRKAVTTPEPIKVTPVLSTPQQAELLVDIGFDVVRVLYMQDGLLRAVRTIPFGISDIAQSMSKQTGVAYYDMAQDLISLQELNVQESIVATELNKIFQEVSKTLVFFEKQENMIFIKPNKIWFSGWACNLSRFIQEAQTFFGNAAHLVDIDKILNRLSIKVISKEKLKVDSVLNLALGIFIHYDENINFLKTFAKKTDNSLLNRQLLTLVFMTFLCLGGIFWTSYSVLQDWQSSYNASRKELIKTINERMHTDIKLSDKNIKSIVQTAQDSLKREKDLWFLFSKQTENSLLQYLLDLSEHIDREAIGLDLTHMHLDYEKASLTGTLKDLEAIEVFEEELMSLKYFTLVDIPRETSFSVQLKVKESQKGSV
ncbi:MAG TPA: pilus assembly protein PilM [Candidatus Saccharimonadales bacterium]|nr:pilus assembly protein PilM [Candidatus Saccharimonadales bacterium]